MPVPNHLLPAEDLIADIRAKLNLLEKKCEALQRDVVDGILLLGLANPLPEEDRGRLIEMIEQTINRRARKLH